MKLHASAPGTYNTITAYGEDYVVVSGRRYESSLVVLPDQVIPWETQTFDSLSPESFLFLEKRSVEIVLLGTGARQRFPHPRLTARLAAAGIGLEVMDLKAAARTYNVLVAEARKVAAALLFK